MSAPSLSICTIGNKQTENEEAFSPSSSTRPFSPVPSRSHFSDDEDDESSSDSTGTSTNPPTPNLRFSFEDWDAPFNSITCLVENDDCDGSQVVSIPSTSPFFIAPAPPVFERSFATVSDADCSLPSICPTLSSKFDLLQYGRVPLSGNMEVMVVETEPVLEDGFPRSIHVVKRMVENEIPDFPEMIVD